MEAVPYINYALSCNPRSYMDPGPGAFINSTFSGKLLLSPKKYKMRKLPSPPVCSYWTSHCLPQKPGHQWFWFSKDDWAQESAFSRSTLVILIYFIRSARDPWVSLIPFVSQTKTWRWNSLQNCDSLCTTNCSRWLHLPLLNHLDVSVLPDPSAKSIILISYLPYGILQPRQNSESFHLWLLILVFIFTF